MEDLIVVMGDFVYDSVRLFVFTSYYKISNRYFMKIHEKSDFLSFRILLNN